MLDRNSFIFYTVDKNYNGIDIELQPKIQRQVFGYNNGYLAQSRLYPQSNDAGAKEAYKNIRAIVQNVITDCLGVANLWEKYNGDIEDIVWKNTHATCYPDWENNSPGASCCTVTYIKELETNPHREIELGEEPICIECGCRHDHDESLYSCEIVQCAECGTWIFEDDEIYINGESYCADCITECNCCGEWKPNYVLTEIDGDWVCPDCMEYSGGLLEMLRMW